MKNMKIYKNEIYIISVSVQCALSNEIKKETKNKVKKRGISQQKINFDKIILSSSLYSMNILCTTHELYAFYNSFVYGRSTICAPSQNEIK